MRNFLLGLMIGVFIIPMFRTIFQDMWWSSHKINILKEPVEFIKDVFYYLLK